MDDLHKGLRAKALEKIRKLLALANDGGATEHEAAAAARQAEKMMRAHQVESAEVVLKEMETDEAFEREVADASPDSRGGHRFTRVPTWCGMVGVGVAKATSTKIDIVGTPAGVKIRFSGYAMDAALAAWMQAYLTSAVERAAKKRGGDRRAGANFRFGAASVLQKRLKEIAEERDAEAQAPSGSTALVLWKTKERRVEEMFGKQKIKNVKLTTYDHESDQAGREAGASIAIHRNRPLGEEAAAKRIAS